MPRLIRFPFWLLAALAALLIVACGGGGGGGGGGAVTTIQTQPVDQTGVVQGDVSFTVQVSGSDLTHQWQRSTDGGLNWVDVALATQPTLTLRGLTADQDGHRFRVRIRHAAGELVSAVVTLSVTSAPTVLTQPQAVSVNVGPDTPAVFTVAAAGNPPPAIQWQESIDGGATFIDIPGAQATTHRIASPTIQINGHRYRARLSNSLGAIVSEAAVLSILSSPGQPTITREPVDASVSIGQRATFTIAVTESPAPLLQWQTSIDGGTTWSDIVGATSATYTSPMLTGQENGHRHRVIVISTEGVVISATAMIHLSPVSTAPTVLRQPITVVTVDGQTATFQTRASSANRLQWQSSTDRGSTYADIPGANASSHAFPASAARSGEMFRVVATNPAGSTTSLANTLVVFQTPTDGLSRGVISPRVGTTVSLDASAHLATHPATTRVTWRLLAAPDLSQRTVQTVDTTHATFQPDIPGTYLVTATGTDGASTLWTDTFRLDADIPTTGGVDGADPAVLAAELGCMACHARDRAVIGPAFVDIATRHAGQAAVEALALKVRRGGSGAWGTVPMPASPVTDEQARYLVEWILGLVP